MKPPVEVAIATVFDGSTNYRCALPLWCITATETSKIIPASEVVVFSDALNREDCPEARWIWGHLGKETLHAVRKYATRMLIQGDWAFLKESALLKIAMLGLTQYDLIVYGESAPHIHRCLCTIISEHCFPGVECSLPWFP